MSYIPSVNIEHGISNDFQYIVTPNTKNVWGNIVSSFHDGIHSFTIIGTYGTGKSSFLAALQRDLIKHTSVLVENHKVFNSRDFDFLNIVGDYASLSSMLAKKLGIAEYATTDEVMTALGKRYEIDKKTTSFSSLLSMSSAKHLSTQQLTIQNRSYISYKNWQNTSTYQPAILSYSQHCIRISVRTPINYLKHNVMNGRKLKAGSKKSYLLNQLISCFSLPQIG